MDELLAWIAFPLAALALCAGIGRLAARIARAELQPAALPALGFATAIVALGPLFATGAGEWWGLGLLVALAAAGLLLSRDGWRPGHGAAAGAAAYALHIAPVALAGTATFLGYNLLNDTALHLALVDWIADHGSRFVEQPPSSYGATINDYVASRYPLGSHELLAALRPVVGLDPAAVYQPFIALAAGLAAAAIFAALRGFGARFAALAAFAALASQLVFSFTLQGSIKELAFVTCLAAAAGAIRRPALLALPAAAMYWIYGLYALPWIAPLALVAFALARPPGRETLTAIAVFLVGIAAYVPDSISYYRHGHDVITSGAELGPLAAPLDVLQASGIWLNGDYRFAPASVPWLTYALAGAVAALALAGLVSAVRRREPGPLLLVVPALAAWAITAPASSPYIDAKLLAVLSPFVVVAAALGLWSLAAVGAVGPAAHDRRGPGARAALVAAIALGAALLTSDALAYRIALVAPADRLAELAEIDARFAGQGPILVNEYEQYVKHFMRRSRGFDPYERWTAARAELRRPELPVAARAYDLDLMTSDFVQRWPLIALRRSPAESRPPSNFDRVFHGRWYDVWARVRPAPAEHHPLGNPPLDSTTPLDCDYVRALRERGRVVAAIRPAPRIVAIGRVRPLPPGWYPIPSDPFALRVRKGGSIQTSFEGSGPVRVWLRGRAFREDEVLIDGRRVGTAKGLNGPNQWLYAGSATLAPGRHRLELRRPKRSLRPGDAQSDVIGPFAIEAATGPRVLSAGQILAGGGPRSGRLCGLPADWIDVLPR